jgi:hypothetical protein
MDDKSWGLKPGKEEAEQQYIQFEDEQEVNGKKYPLLMTAGGLYTYKAGNPYDNPKKLELYTYDLVAEYKKPEPKIIKLNPLFGVKIRAK